MHEGLFSQVGDKRLAAVLTLPWFDSPSLRLDRRACFADGRHTGPVMSLGTRLLSELRRSSEAGALTTTTAPADFRSDLAINSMRTGFVALNTN